MKIDVILFRQQYSTLVFLFEVNKFSVCITLTILKTNLYCFTVSPISQISSKVTTVMFISLKVIEKVSENY